MSDKILRAGVIGLGNIGMLYDFEKNRVYPSTHVSAYMQNDKIELVAGVDITEERKNTFCELAPYANFYYSIEEMLFKEELDVISLCTPPQYRLHIIEQILSKNGINTIFCEKPIALNKNEALHIYKLVKQSGVTFTPNFSRRWSTAFKEIKLAIEQKLYGDLVKIDVRYTRGISNTGSHIFDLISYIVGPIVQVQTLDQIYSSAERDGDPSFSFLFEVEGNISGIAQAFNDDYYYMFEIDLYFTGGKIEIKQSGDQVTFYRTGDHPLFQNFKGLVMEQYKENLLRESHLENAVNHIVGTILGQEAPICTIEDALRPIFVAEAILHSFEHGGIKVKVATDYE